MVRFYQNCSLNVCLPTQVQMILNTFTSEPLATLARMADQIIDVSSPGIFQIRQEPRGMNPVLAHPPWDGRLMELLKANRALMVKFEKDSGGLCEVGLDRRRGTTHTGHIFYGRRSRIRFQSLRTRKMCWYHRMFGDNA